jgi:hypothetical protein
LTIELLTPARAAFLWPQMAALFDQSCKSNPVGVVDITSGDIYRLAQSEQAVIFACFDSGRVATVLALQFNMTNGRKGADVIAMAGRNMLKFKALFWQPILDWLQANGVQYVDAYATPELAKVYTTRFGFDRSCVMVRMTLGESADEQGA